ncbi:3-phenylpropionate/cinnamic acid dioxygenase subunit beta [Ramlibacter sp.]|uniref:3-phenylpropionate/cinnamic acid dioxygenase subunit beta n=1 Tax=Ramlibacter sp. TaxID=1917967 RepID=UPI003D0ACE82
MGAADNLLEKLMLQHEVESFLSHEAELLDERRFNEWHALLADDLRYWMPLARSFKFGQPQDEYTRERRDAAWFDEDKKTLGQRIKQIQGGDHWAEEPASRTTHLVACVRVESIEGGEIAVKSRFVVYASRNEREVQFYMGKRRDVLRRVDGGFRIARREIRLDQNVLLAKAMTIFF